MYCDEQFLFTDKDEYKKHWDSHKHDREETEKKVKRDEEVNLLG